MTWKNGNPEGCEIGVACGPLFHLLRIDRDVYDKVMGTDVTTVMQIDREAKCSTPVNILKGKSTQSNVQPRDYLGQQG